MALVARRRELVDALALPALTAVLDGDLVGVLSYDLGPADCEILALYAARQWAGIGSALINAVVDVASAAGCRRCVVVTTNDNVDALRFYQRRGFHLTALRSGAVDDARRTLKPAIPPLGDYGIPLRDELELTRDLSSAEPLLWFSAASEQRVGGELLQGHLRSPVPASLGRVTHASSTAEAAAGTSEVVRGSRDERGRPEDHDRTSPPLATADRRSDVVPWEPDTRHDRGGPRWRA
jgi:hypothetical protein